MPAHRVCDACGWREPVQPTLPHGTRTWDVSRDDARYAREKRRRDVYEEQRLRAVAMRATPAPAPMRQTRTHDLTVVAMKQSMAG
jgi:hypothetical protein